ncbi:PLAT/LH2 domain [Macleaya cordata]|uniref:PLAT/LH2 domain n=1 Tax=Macleaya cordata TaxID=56857 RepID=A0A200Q044_MACCD|nr:PLAT/LH2 domain [Macleaya cordata]OVA03835.1 PLAT/LH2 domain [Macleaya cordata]
MQEDNDAEKCVYTLYVKTGPLITSGTDSKISVTLGDAAGKSVWIPNLEDWGLMGPTHDYFETGNLDIFSVRGPCIPTPICRLNITSDGWGPNPGWYCEYVEVTSTGPHIKCSDSTFYVEQWLAIDVPPYKLTSIIDGCDTTTTTTTAATNSHARKKGAPYVFGKHQQHHVRLPPQGSSSFASQ